MQGTRICRERALEQPSEGSAGYKREGEEEQMRGGGLEELAAGESGEGGAGGDCYILRYSADMYRGHINI